MRMEGMRILAIRRPVWVILAWLLAAVIAGVVSPDLTRLAAEGQAKLLDDGGSRQAAELVRRCWPDQSFESMIVLVLHR